MLHLQLTLYSLENAMDFVSGWADGRLIEGAFTRGRGYYKFQVLEGTFIEEMGRSIQKI